MDKEKVEKQNLSKLVLKGSVYNIFSLLALKFGGLVFTIILARMLLPELFGIYSLALSIATIVLVFTDLGIDNTFLRYFSGSIEKNKNDLSRSYFKYFLKKKIFLIFAVVIFLLALSKYLSYNIYEKPLLFYPLIFSCLFIISESIKSLFGQFFPAKKDFKSPVFFDVSFQTLKILFSIFAILIFTDSFKVSGIFIALFASSLITFILEIIVISKKGKFLFSGKSVAFEKSKVNSYWKFMVLASISLAFFGSIDMLMLGKFVSAEYIAYYRVSMSLVLAIASIFSLSEILLPIFTQIHGKRFNRGFHKIMRYLLILSIPAVVGAIFIGRYLIKIIYGSEYLLGSLAFYFLTPLIITGPLIALYSIILKSKENPKAISNSILISLIFNIALNIITISLFKDNYLNLIAGVGLSTSLSRIILLSILVISAKKQFNFGVKGLGLRKPVFSTAIMTLFLLFFNRFVDINILTGIIEIILGAGIYFLVLIILKGLKKEDFLMLKSIFKR